MHQADQVNKWQVWELSHNMPVWRKGWGYHEARFPVFHQRKHPEKKTHMGLDPGSPYDGKQQQSTKSFGGNRTRSPWWGFRRPSPWTVLVFSLVGASLTVAVLALGISRRQLKTRGNASKIVYSHRSGETGCFPNLNCESSKSGKMGQILFNSSRGRYFKGPGNVSRKHWLACY